MKQIKTQDSVGRILCHDITRIVKDVTKEAAFRKGHVVREEDIPLLLSMGKEHLYVWESQAGLLHEDDAAHILYQICAGGNSNMHPTAVKEGKIEVIANCDGLLQVDTARLHQINSLGELMIATRAANFPVRKGDTLAGTRVIPLAISCEKMALARELGSERPLLSLHPYQPLKVGIITTGSEIFYGRISDTFSPVIEEKLAEYGSHAAFRQVLSDSPQEITAAILDMIGQGAQLVLCTGGMSVDPDDRTPLAIRDTGAQIISYGAPVLPGAMFMLAYKDGVPVAGLPGCVMYAKRTIFDLVLPRLLAGIPITTEDLAVLGHGGLCLNCLQCTYPNCGFGKGAY